MLKVLLSAYACRPGWGSEPGIGWNWIREISRFAQVHVVTREPNRGAIFHELERNPLPNVEWTFIPVFRGMLETNRIQYYLWQRRIWPVVRELHERIRFDIAHHVTYGVHWMPSPLAKLGIPFIWGPVGGAERAHGELARTLPLRGRAEHATRLAVQGFFRMDPHVRLTASRSTIALATTRDTAAQLRDLGARNVRVFPAVNLGALDYRRLSAIPVRMARPPRMISIGRLLHWKGFDLGIEAFARISREFEDAEYWIVGDGRERERLQKLARSAGVTDRVHFLGARERDQALSDLAACDFLVHPSLHDSGGWVTLEAMAAGRPVICLDAGGPALQVTDSNGFRIAPGPRDRVVGDLANAMRSLLSDSERRVNLATDARRRVFDEFHSATGDRIRSIYSDLVGELVPVDGEAAEPAPSPSFAGTPGGGASGPSSEAGGRPSA